MKIAYHAYVGANACHACNVSAYHAYCVNVLNAACTAASAHVIQPVVARLLW